jgi:acyl-homoserine-lactone acylase
MRYLRLRVAAIAAAVVVVGSIAGCGRETAEGQEAEAVGDGDTYRATVRWTSYGIPHVKAEDWGGLGYGFAYAVATNGVCVLAEEFMRVRGEQSRYLGPGEGRREADVFHRAIITPDLIAQSDTRLPPEIDAMLDGYVAGYNRYLADHGNALPASCQNKPWVAPITREDVARVGIATGTRYGIGRAQAGIVGARPPAALDTEHGAPDATAVDELSLHVTFGSNAIALGRAATANGRGMLLGNPHFPWRGPSRFHIAHLTIPGEIDSMGTGLFTTTIVSIGFNANVAWTHTVSTALRYTLFELDLLQDDPMSYRFGNEVHGLEKREVTIAVSDENGNLSEETHGIYMSHLGPVVMEPDLPWNLERAYVIADANVHNNRAAETYLRFNKARSVDDMLSALRETQGVAWVNTIAADRHGGTLYADISVVPNVDQALLERCQSEHVQTWRGISTVVLRAIPECRWRTDPDSQGPGILPPGEMPYLMREDFVSNSNDSYWLTNPAQPLEGFSPIIGRERYAQSLRTRAGLHFIDEIFSADAERPFTSNKLRDLIYNHRNYGAELLLDDVLEVCGDETTQVELEDGDVDIGHACEVLAEWDRRQDVDSRGAQIWTEFWPRASAHASLWRVPFDADDPVNTPRGVAVERDDVRNHVRMSLAESVQTLSEAGIPLDAAWGEIHYQMHDGEKIGIPGGSGGSGMFSNMFAQLRAGQGYTPMVAGNSWIQVVTWDDDGRLDAHGILTYSQSQEPDSPHYADQTRLYSRGEWINLPFTESEIAVDPNLEVVELESSA